MPRAKKDADKGKTTVRSTAKVGNEKTDDSISEKLGAILGAVNDVSEKQNELAERVGALESRGDAKNNPVDLHVKDFETADKKIGQDYAREMKSTGPASEALSPPDVEVVQGDKPASWYEEMAFMEDVLTIYVHNTSDPTEEPLPFVSNGGENNTQYFIRGMEQKVKRKYVEVLARAKRTRFENEKFQDGNGDDAYRYPSHTALRTDFIVRHDPAGAKGAAWLDNLLAQH